MKKLIKSITLVLLCLVTSAYYYPIDGYDTTGIRRLKRLQLCVAGDLPDLGLPPGAYRSIRDIKLNLTEKKDSPEKVLVEDTKLQKQIDVLFPKLDKSYSVTILDITNPNAPRYAQQNATRGYQPGSVGKLVVLTALFNQLAKIYPNSFEKRTNLLRTKLVKAGPWALTDEHTVPIFYPETKQLIKRQVVATDVFSIYEWADHMLSVSNNGAASVVWREALLMAAFGEKYLTLTTQEIDDYFKNTPKATITDLAIDVVNLPLRQLGISEEEWRLGTFFTRGAGQFVGAKGGSIGSPLGLMKWML